MKAFIVVLLLIVLLAPTDARPRAHSKATRGAKVTSRAHGRKAFARAKAVEQHSIPAFQWKCPDTVEAISQETQESREARRSAAWQAGMYGRGQFDLNFDKWIGSQPKLNTSAGLIDTVQKISREWYLRGRTDATNAVLKKIGSPED